MHHNVDVKYDFKTNCLIVYFHTFQCNTKYLIKIAIGQVEVISSKVLRSAPWLGWPLWNICVSNDHGYVPLVVNTSCFFPHSWLITWCVTRLTRRLPLVEQQLLTLPRHMSSPPVFRGARVTRSLVLCVCFVLFYFFFWPLCCLFFFDIRILITPLVSSNSSCDSVEMLNAVLYIWFVATLMLLNLIT